LQALILLVQTAIDDVGRMSMDLRPSTLDDLGILTTITWFCREFQRIYSGIHIEKETGLEDEDVPEDLKIVIFRVVQEAFNNIAKHSKCTVVHLSLRKRAGSIELAIRDDGGGFDLDPAFSAKSYGKGFGLPSMRERVHLSGGSFSIDSYIGSGTTIVAAWPERIIGVNHK
jgi:signal transduction histidine kinase